MGGVRARVRENIGGTERGYSLDRILLDRLIWFCITKPIWWEYDFLHSEQYDAYDDIIIE